MKKIIIVAIAFFATGQLFAQAGRVRITFLGFKCHRETWDDILGMDGRGDEVFFQFSLSRADQRGNVRQKFDRRTDVYGDRSGAFTNRIKAGSESPTGGIRAGDLVNTNLLLGEYDLDDGDITTIVPSAWEQDPIADNSNAFSATIGGFIGSLNQRVAPLMIGVHLLGGDFAGALFHGASLGLTASRPAGDQGELGRAGTRPIGMKKNGDFIPTVFSINTPNLVTLCRSNYGYGNGVIEVKYDEPALGNNRDHGIYSILLKLEFTPAPAPIVTSNPGVPPPRNTALVPPPSRGIQTLNRPIINKNYTLPADWANSIWTGTRDGQFFALRFDPPSAWILKDVTKYTVENAGLCKASNNVLTFTYYSNNSQYTLTSTYYNATTGELSGIWEKAGEPKLNGTWIVTRKK